MAPGHSHPCVVFAYYAGHIAAAVQHSSPQQPPGTPPRDRWRNRNRVRYLRARVDRRRVDASEAPRDLMDGRLVVEAFWARVRTNLQGERVRMILVADEIPRETQRIIEFLNGQLDAAKVLGGDGAFPWRSADAVGSVRSIRAAARRRTPPRRPGPPSTYQPWLRPAIEVIGQQRLDALTVTRRAHCEPAYEPLSAAMFELGDDGAAQLVAAFGDGGLH